MARTISNGLELSFHKGTKRWCKTHKGKRMYFGSGSGKSDRKSYREALERYRAWQTEQLAKSEQSDVLTRVAEAMGSTPGDPPHEQLRMMAAWATELGYRDKNGKPQNPNRGFRMVGLNEPTQGDEGDSSRTEIEKARAAYIEVCEQRVKLTSLDREKVKPKDRMSKAQFANIKTVFNRFMEYAKQAGVTHFGSERDNEKILQGWRDWLDTRLADGKYAHNTVNNYLRDTRPFILWLWKTRRIQELPRTMDDVFAKYSYKSSAKALTTPQLTKIWAAADERMRCFICLSLNLACYQSELAAIKPDHLVKQGRKTYVAKNRNKTGVPYKHLLWRDTVKRVQMHRDDPNDAGVLFVTRKGLPVCHENGDTLGRDFNDLCKQLKIKATFSQLRDTTTKHIEAIGKRDGDPSLASQILAHTDNRTAVYYLDQTPSELATEALDRALTEVRKLYSFLKI